MSDQLSFDLGDVLGERTGAGDIQPGHPGPPVPAAPARGHRRMRPWEVERAKLKAWQRERRRADQGAPWLVDDVWPLFGASLERLRLFRRVEAEAVRCGCPPPFPMMTEGVRLP